VVFQINLKSASTTFRQIILNRSNFAAACWFYSSWFWPFRKSL